MIWAINHNSLSHHSEAMGLDVRHYDVKVNRIPATEDEQTADISVELVNKLNSKYFPVLDFLA